MLYSDDLAQACSFLMNLDEARYDSLLLEDAPPLINIGTGEDVTIRELAETVARVLGFNGRLVFDTTKPDGTPRKLMDVTRLHTSAGATPAWSRELKRHGSRSANCF